MNQINELSVMLNQEFKWNKARMDCFMAMFGFLNSDYELVLDRTNWKWGKKHQYLDVSGGVQRNSDSDLLDFAEQKRKLEYS